MSCCAGPARFRASIASRLRCWTVPSSKASWRTFRTVGCKATTLSATSPRSARPMSNTCAGAWRRRAASPRRRSVRAADVYDYAIIRVVPRVEREEFINAGVIVSCHATGFLDARIELDEARLRALDPGVDMDGVRRHLDTFPLICRGGEA